MISWLQSLRLRRMLLRLIQNLKSSLKIRFLLKLRLLWSGFQRIFGSLRRVNGTVCGKDASLLRFTEWFTGIWTRGWQAWRLLLCLYALGTNAGFKRMAHAERPQDLLYIKRRFINKDNLRAAIAEVVNAIFKVRSPHIWGETTTACASDSKKFAAWDQNLLTEWHIRYRGPGIMVYWHIDKKSACIHSQVRAFLPQK